MNFGTTNQRIRQVVAAAVFIIPLVYFPFNPNCDYFYNPKVYALTFIVSIYVFILFKNRNSLDNLIQIDRINKALFAYFCLITISLFFAQDIFLALQGGLGREEGYSTMIMYMLLFLAARKVKIHEEGLFNGILISACIVSVYGILQYYGFDPIPRDFLRASWQRSFSTMGNPNFLGSYLVLILPIAMHLFVIRKKALAGFAFGIVLLCLLSTFTRGTWLGGIVSICTYPIILFLYRDKYPGTLRRVVVIMVISGIIVLGFNFQTGNLVFSRFASISNNAVDVFTSSELAEKAGANRIFIWKRVIELITMKPWFGFGIENLAIPFGKMYSADMTRVFGYTMMVDKAHNEYLNIAVSSGIPSLFAYVTFIILIIKKGITRLHNEHSTVPLLSAILGYLVQAFFNISVVSVAYMFWVFLGLLAGDGSGSENTFSFRYGQGQEP